MKIVRTIQNGLENALFKGKIVILYGARQVGKTTLVKEILTKQSANAVYLNCDEPDTRAALTHKNSTQLKKFIGDKSLVVIDEAQRVADIGITLKLMVDNFPGVQIIATGSSSFELSNQVSEPLTGRKSEFFLYPFSLVELSQVYSRLEIDRLLENLLIFGSYPRVVISANIDAEEIVKEIATSYLYKDALAYQDLKKPEVLGKILSALALQIGQEVSYTELAGLTKVDKITVEKYIHLLEQAFVIFQLPAFSRNLRKEIGKRRKIYFFDLGVRNSLINNFNPLELRADVGSMWENFLIAERQKATGSNLARHIFFWRVYSGGEVDYLEEHGGKLDGYEFKWGKGRLHPPKDFMAYEQSSVKLVNRENYWDFLTDFSKLA